MADDISPAAEALVEVIDGWEKYAEKLKARIRELEDENRQLRERMRKKRIRMIWTCSDFVHHEHRWWITAHLCGKVQQGLRFLRLCLIREGR